MGRTQTLLALAMACLFCTAATDLEASPSPEHWITYAGDFANRHAMDTLSVRKTGDVATFKYLIIGRKGPLRTDEGPVAYIIQDFAFDCAKRTNWIMRASFFDRTGKRLRSREFPTPDPAPATSAVALTFLPYACGGSPAQSDPHPHDSLGTLLEETYGWWTKASVPSEADHPN